MMSEHYHFIGIGGAGMAPLAKIVHERGAVVSGSDLEEGKNTALLREMGISIHIGHHDQHLPSDKENLTVIFSSAVDADNPELREAANLGIPCFRRGIFLAKFAEGFRRPVAVSGSHGKTTITAMISHILRVAGCKPGYLVGGNVNGWDCPASAGTGDSFVCEVDESDGTHTFIHPWLGIVPNVEDDHCWSVGGKEQLYRNFATFASQCRKLIYVKSAVTDQLFGDHPDADPFTVEELTTERFDTGNLNLTGQHQTLNARLAVEAACQLGVRRGDAERAVLSFPGVNRRLTLHHQGETLVFIEDYAHHPTEIRFAISALRERFPGYWLKVVFQPHRYARLARYLDEFACELRNADAVTITPVFAAWTSGSEVGPDDLARKIGNNAAFCDLPWEQMATTLIKSIDPQRKTVLAVFGAGDIECLVNQLRSRLR